MNKDRNTSGRWVTVVAVVVLAGLAISQCSNSSVGPVRDPVGYFPAAVGDSWTYVLYDTLYVSSEYYDSAPADCGDGSLPCWMVCDTVTVAVVGDDSMTTLGIGALRWSFDYPDSLAALGGVHSLPSSFLSVFVRDSPAQATVQLFSYPGDTIAWLSIPVPLQVGQAWCQGYYCVDTGRVVGTEPALMGRRNVGRAFVIDRSWNEALYAGHCDYSFVPYVGFSSMSYRVTASVGYRSFIHRQGALALLEYTIEQRASSRKRLGGDVTAPSTSSGAR